MEKLLAIVNLGQYLYGRLLLQRFLRGALAGLFLLIVTSMMIGIVLVGGLYIIYALLGCAGLSSLAALLMTGGFALLITLMLLLVTNNYFRRLQSFSKQSLHKKAPPISQASDIIDSFLQGLMGSEKKR